MEMADGIIVVAVDGSPFGSPVVPYAEEIARLTHRPLRLFAVAKREARILSPAASAFAQDRERAEYERLEAYLADAAASIRSHGVEVSTVLVSGDPTDAILTETERSEVSLVALSTQGLSGLDRWAMGSVADKVMRLSSKPTLIVRRPYIPFPEESVTIRSILVPLDGSRLAEQALPLTEPFIGAGATILLVRVEPWLTEGSAPYGTVPEFVEIEQGAARAAKEYLAKVSRQLVPGTTIQYRVLRGRAAESLADFAWYEHIDLAVMTTHGVGGLRRFVVGSTADFLVRAGVPTLLVRPEIATLPYAPSTT